MAKQAPDPVDVQDFQFILQCRLKIFSNEDNAVFSKPCNLLATASRFGLVFVGTASAAFQVILLNTIEKHSVKEGDITNYARRIVSLPSPPKHLAVNCDCTKLAVVVEQNDCPIALIYDVTSMMKQELSVPIEIRLSPTPGVTVTETSWNPTISNIFTACKSDGTLGLYELKETGVDINELPAESQATCMCWSPKGKQIAVGSHNGKITQYKPDLKAMKVVNSPPVEGPPSVIALQWISNYQFIAVYKAQNVDNGANLLVVDAPKTGDTVYTNYDDICYSFGNTRPVQFYTVIQSTWNILMVASSNSMEVGVLGNLSDQWMLWILADSARAELPLSVSKQETLPIGLAFDASATQPVIWGESSLPPAPYLLLLSHHGLLCCFRVINIKSGIASICQAPEPLPDTSGLSQFTSIGPVDTAKVSSPEPEKQAVPPKSTEPLLQAPFPLPQSSASATAKLPQVPLFTNPPSSLFGSQFPFQAAKPESAFMPKLDSGSLFIPKPVPQNLFGPPIQQPTPVSISTTAPAKGLLPAPSMKPATPAISVPSITVPTVNLAAPVVSLPTSVVSPMLTLQSSEANIGQEDAEILISKLVREECETLETELKALLHKGRCLKIDLGTDTEAVELVHGADMLEDFLKELNETSAGQSAEVHSLKQELIQTWAWYEDARSRFAQTQDLALETLLRIQKLDPVSQRYEADIQHMTYYLNSQLAQAGQVLDEQWENFQDSCRKVVKFKIPTMETIYRTMVRQSAIHQRQQYILKDISSRIRAHRSKITNPSLLVSLNNADQLEKELRRLQLEPQHFLQAQYERVLQNQQQLTSSKVQKLSNLLYNRDIVRVTYNKPKLSTSALQAAIQSSPRNKNLADPSLLGTGLSPITSSKHPEPRAIDFVQSTPKPSTFIGQKQNSPLVVVSSAEVFKAPMPAIAIKFTSGAPIGTPTPSILGQLPTSGTTATAGIKIDHGNAVPSQFKFAAISTASVISSSASASATTSTTQLNFGFDPVSTTTKVSSAPISFTSSPITPAKAPAETSQSNQISISTSGGATKPSVSFGSLFSTTKPAPSTFSFSLTTTTIGSSVNTAKPLASTPSSAFVPTTQLPFNFSAKVPISTSVSSLVSSSSAVSKPPTFVFGTTMPKADSTTTDLSQAMNTGATTIPNTTSVTVVAGGISSTTSSAFGTFKTSTADSTLATTTSASPLVKAPSAETTTASSIFQGLLAPKTTASVSIIQQAATESASIPSSATTTPASATDNTVPVTVSSNHGSCFGMAAAATPQAAIFNLAGTKVTQPVIASATTATSSVIGGVTITKVEKQPSIFSKVTSTTGPILETVTTTTGSLFGTAASTNNTTGSLISSAASTTITGSIFGATPTIKGSIFDTTTAVSSTGSIFGTPPVTVSTAEAISEAPPTSTSTTAGTIFGSAATTTISGSLFNAAVTATTASSIFAAVGSQQGSFLSTTTSSSTSIFSAVPTAAVSPTVFATNTVTPTTTAVTTTSSSGFAIPATTSGSIFGIVPTTAPSISSSASVFSVPATTTGSIFGAVPATTSIFGSSGFGTTTTTTAPSVFAQSTSAGSSVFATAATSPVFGELPKTTASGPFGTSGFGSDSTSSFSGATTVSGSLFGQPAVFGAGSLFGAPVSSSANTFGSNFASGGSVFAAPNTTPSNFGQSQSSTFSFAAAAANVPSSNSAFGFSKPSTAFGFGDAAGSTDSSSFSFGNLNVAAATTTSNTSTGFGSVFSQSPNSNPFAKASGQEQKPAFGGGSLFGTPTTTGSSSIFGGGSTSTFGNSPFGSPSSFGSPSTFGQQQPAFGQSSFGGSFGSSPSQPGPFSTGNQTVAQTGFGGFGQAQKPSGFGAAPVFGGTPAFGSSPPAFGAVAATGFGSAPAFGTPPKVFGPNTATATFGTPPQQENPTFANLATQNTLGFGSLAQQSQPNPSMSSFSGGSSFSTWR